MFGKTSTDLAAIIRSSLEFVEFDVKKYHEHRNLFACRQCFQQLTKYERAAKKLREIKQELLTAFRNREQLREKRLAHDENRDDLETINNGDERVSAAKSFPGSLRKLHLFIPILPLVLLILHVHRYLSRLLSHQVDKHSSLPEFHPLKPRIMLFF